MIELLRSLTNNLGYVLFIAFFVSNFNNFKKIIQKDEFERKDIVILSLIFGAFGIIGTYTGTNINGAIANTRMIGVMTGGILCGPFVGLMSGIIAGLHRFLINVNGVTTLPCTITTILAGVASGYIYHKSNEHNKWFYGLLGGLIMEIFEMFLIMIMVPDFDIALSIVKSVYFPMSFANAIGIAMLILIIQKIFKEKDEISAKQAQLALEIANKTLPYFREMNSDSLENICQIIKDSINADAVAITDKEYVLAHVGVGSEQNLKGSFLRSEATKKVLHDGKLISITDPNQIECPNINHKLRSGIIAPLKEGDSTIGALKIYYCKEDAVSFINKTLADGLSQIISTQLEISKLSELKNMATRAEIKALQAQINPHFLFNALNAVVSFIRIDPNYARNLILDLSTYLRYNLEIGDKPVGISKELEQVKAYVAIEQARFGDKLNVVYEVEDDLDFKIPSLTIQPIVENSIKHGILEGEGHGTVKISIKKLSDSDFMISIEDDGSGIPLDIINNIYNDDMAENKIGMANVNKRLKYIYGEGLKVENLDKGSKVYFNIKNKEN